VAIRVGGIEIVISANVSDATKAFTTLGRKNKSLQSNLKQSKTLFGGLGNQINSVKGALVGLSSAFAAVKFGNVIKDSTLLAARVKNLGTVLNNVGRIAGFNSAQIRNVENSVKKLGITTRSARQSLTQLAQANIDLSKAAKLTRIAQDAAVIAGVDSSEAFNRLVVSIQRNDVRLLRNLGIVINLNSVYQKFAQTTGRTAASLTAVEKRQLVLNEVIAKGALITGTYEASLNDSFKQLTSLRRVVEEASRVFGEQFEPALDSVVKTASQFLKRFAEGQTAIGPRFIAVVGVAIVTLGALAAVIGAVAAAITAAAIAGGPLTIFLVALAAVLGIAAAAWVNYKLELGEAETRLKKVAEEAENTAQAISDSADEINRIKDLAGKPFGISVDEAEELRVIAEELARQFPKLRNELLALGDAGDAVGILELFGKEIPEALLTSEEALAQFDKRRIAAEKNFRFEVKETFRVRQGLERKADAERQRAFGSVGGRATAFEGQVEGQETELNAVLAGKRAREEFNEAIKNGTNAFIEDNAVLVQNNERLRKFADELIRVEAAARQLRQARLTQVFQEFQEGLKQLEQGANQAIQILSKLENDRIRLFKGTNIGFIDDFTRAQAQLISVDIRTKEQLQDAAEAFSAAQLEDLRNINLSRQKELGAALRKEEITRAEFDEKTLKNQRSFDAQQRRIATQSQALIEDGVQQQNTILEARTKALANVTRQLEEQERATAELLQLQELEASGVAPKLISLRKKFSIATRGASAANRELIDRMQGLNQQFRDLGAGGIAARFGDLTEIPKDFKENLSGPITNLLTQLFSLNRAFAANRDSLLAKEQSFNAQFKLAVQERNKALVEEQEKLNEKLIDLGDDAFAKINTVGEAQSAVDALDSARKAAADFIQEINTGFRDKAAPGIAKLNSEFSRFGEALKNATDPNQIASIQRLFPKVIAQQIKSAKDELTKLTTQLETFQSKEKPAQKRDDRIERQKRFNELVDAGVPAFKARQEVQRIELEQRKELEAKEKAITDAVSKQRMLIKTLADERTNLEVQFNLLITQQTAELEKQLAIRQKLADLKAQEVAATQAELTENKKQQEQLAKAAAGGLTGKPTTPAKDALAGAAAASPGTPAQVAAKASTVALQKLSKEAVALKKALEEQGTATTAAADTTRTALESIKDNAFETQQELNDIFELLERDAEAGKAAFAALRLRTKR